MLTKILKIFEREKILLRHSVLNYTIDLYFSEHKLAIEVDEKGHKDREEHKEIERQKAIEKELDCEFLLELILMNKTLIWTFTLVKYKVTLLNHLNN